jgi:hypothetical protein
VAAVTTHQQGFVEVYLRGGHVLTVEGTMDDFAPLRLESYSSKNFAG